MKTLFCLIILCTSLLFSQQSFEKDTLKTDSGDLVITFIGHGTLMFEYAGRVIHVDPVSRFADYSKMPKADLILVTHQHGDHLDMSAIGLLQKMDTKLYLTQTCFDKVKTGKVLANGQSVSAFGIKVEAVPAYNLVHKRDNGTPFHPRGEGNGYVLSFGSTRVYIAGDTENVPEMKKLAGVDVAFVPMNLPYTMTPEMTADAVHMLNPKIFYPYHFGESNVDTLLTLLQDMKDCDIRVRQMQ